MKRISEYEFEITRNGKKQIVQQSETNRDRAERAFKKKIKGITCITFKKRFSYPHLEGGRKP